METRGALKVSGCTEGKRGERTVQMQWEVLLDHFFWSSKTGVGREEGSEGKWKWETATEASTL